jgi:hypothetical protein
MKNRNYGDSQQQPAPFEDFPPRGVELMIASSVPMTLTEPLLQGRDSTCRFFVDYCEHLSSPCFRFRILMSLRFRIASALPSCSKISQGIHIEV